MNRRFFLRAATGCAVAVVAAPVVSTAGYKTVAQAFMITQELMEDMPFIYQSPYRKGDLKKVLGIDK